jgi:flagellar protein FliL
MDNDQYLDEENADNDEYLDEYDADAEQYSDEENADSGQSSNEEGEAYDGPKPKKSRWPLWVIVATVIAGGGTAIGMFFFIDHGKETKAESAHNKPVEAVKNAIGPLVEMRPLVANLTDPDVDKYAKITLFIEADNEESKATLEKAIVPMRSQALLYLSSISSKDMYGAEKKMAIGEHLKAVFEKVVGKRAIKQVHFGEFVIQ